MKKGFTLIELLAIIIILGILSLISIPIVTNLIEISKKGTYVKSIEGLIEAVKLDLGSNNFNKNREYELDRDDNNFYLIKVNGEQLGKREKIRTKGLVEGIATIVVDNDGDILIAATNEKWCVRNRKDDATLVLSSYTGSCNIDYSVGGTTTTTTLPETPAVPKKCKRATTLHTETCDQADATYYCSGAGYTASGSKGTTTITYGSLGTSGTLTPGDAFDCDVNGDGTYDATTERFYYVSDLEGDSNKAVLIYYNNVSNGEPFNGINNTFAYNTTTGYLGPQTAMLQLPTTTQWPNVSLSNTTRNILDEEGNVRVTGFSYAGYATRLLTVQEIKSACRVATASELATVGSLDTCNYLIENTKYSNSEMGSFGLWLENVDSSRSTHAWDMIGLDRYSNYNHENLANRCGVRPAIEVSKDDIQINF